MTRTFEATLAKREKVPLLIGLMGCSGSGKTFSALRLAAGIQKVSGGDIYVIDTESKRAAHYAESFKFQHVEFKPPFGSVDYLEVLRFCVKQGAGVIVVDSMSHEHSGEGGYLDYHGREIERMSGGDSAKAERVKMAGWIKPSSARQKLINGILQLNANFIFCFRAKEKTKPKQGGGIQEMGWMPIAGDEFLFEQTLNCLLPPNARGVPQWRSDFAGEKMMMKLPKHFEPLFADARPLDEAHGQALAEWARGTIGLTAGGRTTQNERTEHDREHISQGVPPTAASGAGLAHHHEGRRANPVSDNLQIADKPGAGAGHDEAGGGDHVGGQGGDSIKPKAKTAAEWCNEAASAVMKTASMKELNAWVTSNQPKITQLLQKSPKLAGNLQDIIMEQTQSFNTLLAG